MHSTNGRKCAKLNATVDVPPHNPNPMTKRKERPAPPARRSEREKYVRKLAEQGLGTAAIRAALDEDGFKPMTDSRIRQIAAGAKAK